MEQIYYYKNNVTWKFKRIGELSEEGMTPITVATPPEFKGGVPNTWTPEHLFVASVNICLMTTFLAIAENSKLQFVNYSSDAIGKIEKVNEKYMFSEITITPTITVTLEKDLERAERILEKAKMHCLVSNSIKANVIINPNIVLAN